MYYDLILHTLTCSDLPGLQALMNDLWSLWTSNHSLHAMILRPGAEHCDEFPLSNASMMIPKHSILKCCPKARVGAKCLYFNSTVEITAESMFMEETSTCFLWNQQTPINSREQ